MIAVLLAVLLLLTGWVARASAAPFLGTTQNGVNNLRADTLAAPTSLAVAQQCVADPTPVRRPGAGGSSFTSGGSSGTLTIARPSGAQAGDVMVAGISWGDKATITDASGLWTPIYNPMLGDPGLGQQVYYRVVTASEPSSYSWTSTAAAAAGGIVVYSGVDPVAPVNAFSGQVSGDKVAPSLTTTRANVRLVGLWAIVGAQTPTVPAGMTQIWNGASSGNGGATLQVTSVGADESWPTPGATGTRTLTSGGSRSVAQLVALQPPQRPFATSTWTISTSTYATGQLFRRSSGGTVLSSVTLSATANSRTSGPLTSGTPYTVEISATFANWSSTATAASFTGLAC